MRWQDEVKVGPIEITALPVATWPGVARVSVSSDTVLTLIAGNVSGNIEPVEPVLRHLFPDAAIGGTGDSGRDAPRQVPKKTPMRTAAQA